MAKGAKFGNRNAAGPRFGAPKGLKPMEGPSSRMGSMAVGAVGVPPGQLFMAVLTPLRVLRSDLAIIR